MKLSLCSGDKYKNGWINHDIRPLNMIDIVCDLRDIHKHIKPASCEEIEFAHALEHFPQKEIVPILTMIHSLLVPGGKFTVEVPNFAWHAGLVVMDGKDREAVYYAFGGQTDEFDFHKTGFTESILKEDLESAGFKNIQLFPNSSLSATCTA